MSSLCSRSANVKQQFLVCLINDGITQLHNQFCTDAADSAINQPALIMSLLYLKSLQSHVQQVGLTYFMGQLIPPTI